jgi:undecaprenyl-phosphate galactose phosphotransferase
MMLCVIYFFSFLYNDLYKRNIVLSRYLQFLLLLKSLLIAGILSVIVMTFFNVEYLAKHGRRFFIYFSGFNLLFYTTIRIIFTKEFYKFLSKRNIYKRRLLIIGGDDTGKHVLKAIRKDKIIDFFVIGFLDDYKRVGENIFDKYHNLGKLDDLETVVQNYNVDEILIAIDNLPYNRMIHIVDKCLEVGEMIRIYSNFLNVISNKMNVEFYSTIPVIMLSQFSLQGFLWIVKKILDKSIALILLIFLSPLFLFISIAIKLSSKGPVIYTQTRIGKDGKSFKFYKFRSMYMNTDDSRHKEFVKDVWFQKRNKENSDSNKVFRIKNDPRIFKFGKFIRKTSLDELPQLYNVLKGDMSIVGPRPCMPFEWEMYEEWHKNRMNILPGCTGLWQAIGRATVSFEEMVILDLYYISNMTLWLDLKIIVNTIPVILFGKGGY